MSGKRIKRHVGQLDRILKWKCPVTGEAAARGKYYAKTIWIYSVFRDDSGGNGEISRPAPRRFSNNRNFFPIMYTVDETLCLRYKKKKKSLYKTELVEVYLWKYKRYPMIKKKKKPIY